MKHNTSWTSTPVFVLYFSISVINCTNLRMRKSLCPVTFVVILLGMISTQLINAWSEKEMEEACAFGSK